MSLGVGGRGFAAALSLAVGLSATSPGWSSPAPSGAPAAAVVRAADEGAGCLPDREPNDRLEDVQAALEDGSALARGTFCAVGTLGGADQDIIVWEVTPGDAGRAWSLSLAGEPGALTVLQVKSVTSEPDAPSLLTGIELLDLSVAPEATGPAVLDDVFVAAGRYLIGLGAGGQPAGPEEDPSYRLELRPRASTPPLGDAEPNDDDASASPVRGAFAVSGDGEGSPDTYRWTLGEGETAGGWALGLRTRLDDGAMLVLAEADGSALVRAAARHGRVDIPDLRLAAGEYLVRVETAASGPSPYLLSATAGDVPGADPEPNDDARTAVAMDPARPVTRGRLAREQDEDWFAFSVAAGDDEDATLGIRLLWASEARRELCLRGPGGEEVQCRSSADGIVLPGLSLPAGEYRLQVKGDPAPDDPYVLRVDPAGSGAPDFEREPNDRPVSAAPFDARLGMRGRASAGDVDHFAILVRGQPQVWQLEAAGSGIASLDWIKADGTRLASGAIAADRSTALLTDMYLIPGRHWVRLEGGVGEYTLRMTSLGPIDPDAEREPNDRTADAERLPVGTPRKGRLPTREDVDRYRFRTRALDRLLLSLTAPSDAALEMRLSDGVGPAVELHAAEGQTIAYDGLLREGHYTVDLRADRAGGGRYGIGLERADPFDLRVDQEPNDSPGDARPLPLGIPVDADALGADGSGDEDWYVLEAPAGGGSLLIVADGDVGAVELWEGDSQVPLETAADGVTHEATGIEGGVVLHLRVRARGDYRLSAGPDSDVRAGQHDGAASPRAEAAGLQLRLDLDGAPVAAHWPDGQTIPGTASLTDLVGADGDVTLDVMTSDAAWEVRLERTELAPPPGTPETIPFVVRVPPDVAADEAVRVTLRAARADGSATTAFVEITPSREASPSTPARHWPLPGALLGALDVGSLALGAEPIPSLDAEEEARLHDGFAPSDWGLSRRVSRFPVELELDLAGDEPVEVAGTIIQATSADPSLGDAPRRFRLDLSLDGAAWETALVGELVRSAGEQAFVLDRPSPARLARLVIETTQRASPQRIELGEWKVLATPGTPPPSGRSTSPTSRPGATSPGWSLSRPMSR